MQAPCNASSTPPEGGRIDRGDVQVLFVDLQGSIVAQSRTVSPADLGSAAVTLAEIATALDLPMLFSVVPEGGAPPALIPELTPYATSRNTILRQLAGVFMDPPTIAALAANRRRTLVIGGFSAETAVRLAALGGIAAGYTVHYLVDVVGSRWDRTEAATFRAIEQAGAIPSSLSSINGQMAPDFHHADARSFAAVQKHARNQAPPPGPETVR